MKRFLCAIVLGLCAVQASEEILEIDAVDLETLRSKAGLQAAVTGVVTEVGSTKDGGITFINLGLPKKQGFVAVIFRKDYDSFPDGFAKYKDQKVKVTGLLELYRTEQPQIVLKSPEQISVLTE
jgi:hypothetical protein